jgi:protein-ribulosamine 3-kinase
MYAPSLITAVAGKILNTSVTGFRPASGGCINHGGELITDQGSYFVKWNDLERYPGMFRAEAKGLQLLRAAKCVDVPEVIRVHEEAGQQVIVMQFILSSAPQRNYWSMLGEQLAALHRQSNEQFGLDHDNYIGSLPQRNTPHNSWIEFFLRERLGVQLELAERNGLADSRVRIRFDKLYSKLAGIFPEEKPALLHGDLWSGNLIVNRKGEPCLIDPAVYYGHREAELAFTQLFGGSSNTYYDAYHNAFPLEPGFHNRAEIYNLYPLLVHANLFGGGYLQQAERILKRYV